MHRQAPGTREDKRRRIATLKSKMSGLLKDLIGVFLVFCLPSALFLVSESFYSSRRLIMSYAFAYSLSTLALFAVNVSMHIKARKAKKKRRRVQAMASIARFVF